MAESLLGVNPPGVSFEVLVHLATVFSIIVLYRQKLLALSVGVLRLDRDALNYVGMLALASVPAAAAGLTLAGAVARLFDRPLIAALNLMITGCVVYATRWLLHRGDRPNPGWLGSLGVGVAQALALLPGISRSGMTVAAALMHRSGRAEAAQFSFLLSIPAIVGASFLQLPDAWTGGAGPGAAPLAAAALAAFLAGMLAIVLFVRWLRVGHFHRFAYYCWAVGGSFMVYSLITS
jgi:undecaprenyl-diphosphatase